MRSHRVVVKPATFDSRVAPAIGQVDPRPGKCGTLWFFHFIMGFRGRREGSRCNPYNWTQQEPPVHFEIGEWADGINLLRPIKFLSDIVESARVLHL